MNKSIDRLLKNYSNARKSFEIWCFMVSIEERGYKNSVKYKVDNNELFFNLRYLAFKDFHIELYKVLKKSHNNKDNIFHHLDTAIKNRPSQKAELTRKVSRLDELKDGVKKITDLRDKFYAHLDEDFERYLDRSSVPYVLILEAIEQSLIAITSKDIVQEVLRGIRSRDHYSLTT